MDGLRSGSLVCCLTVVALAAAPAARAAARATPRERGSREWMDEGYRRKAARDLAGAAAAFEAARARGFDAQRVDLELAYVALARGDATSARARLESAAGGPDGELGRRALAELAFVPGHRRGELYLDAYGWSGVAGESHVANAVPTFRARLHHRPWLDEELSLYVFAQAVRDLASQGGALPRVYADNTLLLGPGALLPLWQKRAGLFLQAGAALPLLDDGRQGARFDARGGAYLGLESRGCAPARAEGARLALVPCADLYTDAVWVSRFDHEIVLFARGRAGAAWLSTGPVTWQLLAEARGAANRNRDHGEPFAEAGLWHRWRLLWPVQLDALVGLQQGRAVALGGRAVTRPGAYTEVRFQLASTLEL